MSLHPETEDVWSHHKGGQGAGGECPDRSICSVNLEPVKIPPVGTSGCSLESQIRSSPPPPTRPKGSHFSCLVSPSLGVTFIPAAADIKVLNLGNFFFFLSR